MGAAVPLDVITGITARVSAANRAIIRAAPPQKRSPSTSTGALRGVA
jgi:hypothetical protein